MKYFAFGILFAVLALVSADEFKIKTQEDLVKVRKECVESKKVPAEKVELYKKFDFPDDETTRCYIECVFTKFGLFNSKDGFQVDNLVKQLGQNRTQNEVKPEIEACVDNNQQASDGCAWVFRGFKCFIEKNLPLVQKSLKAN